MCCEATQRWADFRIASFDWPYSHHASACPAPSRRTNLADGNPSRIVRRPWNPFGSVPPANNPISREEVAMERRTFLAGAAVAAMGLGVKSAAADRLPLGDLPNWRYPDPRVEVLDPRFKYKVGNATIERIA